MAENGPDGFLGNLRFHVLFFLYIICCMLSDEQIISTRICPEPNTGCWIWLGNLRPDGYGRVWRKGNILAHRFVFEYCRGPIPFGLTIDHLCRNHWCVNPIHLEAVSVRTNIQRGGRSRQTHCVHGHEFTPGNTYIEYRKDGIHRACRFCHNNHAKIRYHRRRARP